jgi:hypothetical protein
MCRFHLPTASAQSTCAQIALNKWIPACPLDTCAQGASCQTTGRCVADVLVEHGTTGKTGAWYDVDIAANRNTDA